MENLNYNNVNQPILYTTNNYSVYWGSHILSFT